MSRYHKEQIECPHCHHKGEFDLWESVNVDLDPELRRQILSDRLIGRLKNILDNNKLLLSGKPFPHIKVKG